MNFFELSRESNEAIYKAIRKFIIANISAEWEQAVLTAEIAADDHGRTSGRYFTPSGEAGYFSTDYTMYFAMDELRRRSHQEGEAKWHKADFVLQRTGKYSINLTYPE